MLLARIFVSYWCFYAAASRQGDIFDNRNGEGDGVLFPDILNLAAHAIIKSNATCGEAGPADYCKLVEHVFMRQPQCDICDDSEPDKRHPVEFAIDGTNAWWQSPSLARGLQYEWVTITLDLRQEFQVAYIIVQSAIAPRPGTWVLERSLDNETWNPWQYYANSDEECMSHFNVSASRGRPKFKTDDEVICTSLYSKLDPLEDGEIHTSLINGRPGIDGPTETLKEFTRARYIRLRFQKLRTLNADLTIISRWANHTYIDQSVTRRYFYAIKEITIGGQCICHGHARSCPRDDTVGQLKCLCQHNTCGGNCERCCPMFNQRPWMPGSSKDPHVCKQCQCFQHAVECKYDAEVDRLRQSLTPDGVLEGGGLCIDCQHNTQGVNCQECKDKYYRPAGVSHYQADACRPCDCDMVGSSSDVCVKDDTTATNGQKPGDCLCKPGFGGRRCEQCAVGFRKYPICEPCPCNRHGSANFAYCESDCVCKRNVEGEFCDKCKPGFFNLDEHNPDGCTKCFCFGMSKECRESDLPMVKITALDGWVLTRDSRQTFNRTNVTENEQSHALVSADRSMQYWVAPKEYTGNLLSAYGSRLRYFVYYVPEQDGPDTGLSHVVLKGNRRMLEYYYRQTPMRARENISIEVPLIEDGWFDMVSRQYATKEDFMTVLANIESLLVLALYNYYQIQSTITGLTLEKGEKNAIGTAVMRSVEQCVCPDNFVGLSCEACVHGMRRVGNQLFNGQCERCECLGHSETCEPYSGNCTDCQHNTDGPRCNVCKQGHYGNPQLGGEDGVCSRCACPLMETDNNFSPTCATELGSVEEYVCTSCIQGYIGRRCEMCADGYFGQPMVPGNYCQPCMCNENIDLAAIGNCNRTSGQCLKCIGNTTGWHCEQCKHGYYGSALAHTCQACGCNKFGSTDVQCNNETGLCDCRENYEDRTCGRCIAGHGDIEHGCPPCACDKIGALADACDQVSGQCSCRPGVFGKNCGQCSKSYFNMTTAGCTFCGCDSLGSTGECNNVTGQCMCKEHVVGRTCMDCEDGYYNKTSGSGCQACNCHALGAEGMTCDQRSGRCRCKTGVEGDKCDKCMANYWGLSMDGCKKCPICRAPGHVCHPDTGECICPPNTVGDMCESCTENAWNYHPLKGCELCTCESKGAKGPKCDKRTGQCECLLKYTGLKCDQCQHGFYDFPNCMACACKKAGTEPSTCLSDGTCSCADDGQCQCKANVEGVNCDKCKADAIALEDSNPLGCVKCYCFGRGDMCVQSNYVWQQIYAEPRQAIFAYPGEQWNRVHALQVFPREAAVFNSYPTDHTPIYWPLPRPFLGDKTTSYNGVLRFAVANYANPGHGYEQQGQYLLEPDQRFLHGYALVVLVGNHRVILEYFAPRFSVDGVYTVRLREDLWRSRHRPDVNVQRDEFMAALQNLQAIYIRGTYSMRVYNATLSQVVLDVAVLDSSALINKSGPAMGVEHCDCKNGYSGLSCQDPADGYCRKRLPDYLNSPNAVDLVGTSELCSCNNHTRMCDKESCDCLSCEHNTTGQACQFCERGFYGDATKGSTTSCNMCACPLVDNSFSPTCQASTFGRGFVCDACAPGYMGQYCETCVRGYYGDPTLGGACLPCNCNPDGSLQPVCDPVSGQCHCRPELRGRDCSECQPRHALVNRYCTSCDVGCTKGLMLDVDLMEEKLASFNFSGVLPAPWLHLGELENRSESYRDRLQAIQDGQSEAKKYFGGSDDVDRLQTAVEAMQQKATIVGDNANVTSTRAAALNQDTRKVELDANNFLRKLREIVAALRKYRPSQTKLPTNVTAIVVEAGRLLQEMVNRTDKMNKRLNSAEQELSEAKELLQRILDKTLNETRFDALRDILRNMKDKLSDLSNRLVDEAWRNTSEARKFNDISAAMKKKYLENLDELKHLQSRIEDLASEGNEKSAEAGRYLLHASDYYRSINLTLLEDIVNRTDECSLRSTQYRTLLPEYNNTKVAPAHQHAATLQRTAEELSRSFKSTKDASQLAVKASQAYKDIVDALNNASVAAQAALDASNKAHSETVDKLDDVALTLNNSIQIRTEANALSEAGLNRTLAQDVRELRNLSAVLASKNAQFDRLVNGFSNFDAVYKKVNKMESSMATLLNEAAAQETKAMHMNDEVKDLEKRVQEYKSLTSGEVKNLTAAVEQSRRSVQDAKQQLDKVVRQEEQNRVAVDNLADKLKELRELVLEARAKAAKIGLSVRSPDAPATCQRSFVVKADALPATRVEVYYRPTSKVDDAMIVSVFGSRRPQVEYFLIEIVEKRVQVRWNIGIGQQKLVNQPSVNFIPDGDVKSWYYIDVQRRGALVELNVTLLPQDPSRSTNAVSNEGNTREYQGPLVFNTDADGTVLASLGMPEEGVYQNIDASVRTFKGTVAHVKFDGQVVPLWDFKKSTSQCKAFVPIKLPDSDRQGVQPGFFFRDGYAQVPTTGQHYDADNTRLEVRLATYVESGLIYFRGVKSNADFVSLEIVEGRVVAQVFLGFKSNLTLVSDQYINDGKFYTIEFTRDKLNATLRVGQREPISAVIPGNSHQLNAKDSDHYVGGVPESFDGHVWRKYNVRWKGFYGCIQKIMFGFDDVLIDRANKSLNVESNCRSKPSTGKLVTSDREVGFSGKGYLLVPGVVLNESGLLSLNFRSVKPEGILLYQPSTVVKRAERRARATSNGYMSIALDRGEVVAMLFVDGGNRVELRSTQIYSDGQMHNVLLRRHNNEVTMYIDDNEVGSQLLGSTAALGFKDSQVLLGGLGSFAPPGNEVVVKQALTGCVAQVYVNFERLSLVPTDLEHASVGFCATVSSPDDVQGGVTETPEEVQADQPKKRRKQHLKRKADAYAGTKKLPITQYASTTPVPTPPRTNPEVPTGPKVPGACPSAPIPSSEFGAVRFGRGYNTSYIRMPLADKTHERKFKFSFDVRTDVADGLILLMTSKDMSQYVGVAVREGLLVVKLKGRKNAEHVLRSGQRVDTKLWVKVTVEKANGNGKRGLDGSHVSLMVDGKEHRMDGVSKRLTLKNVLYVGGFPASPRTLNDVELPNGSLQGCVRNFEMNGLQVDLGTQQQRNVDQCYVFEIAGLSFAGDSYMRYALPAADSLRLSFAFRTHQADAILAAVLGTDFAWILLDGGQLSVELPWAQLSTSRRDDSVLLCDSEWHVLRLQVTAVEVVLEVDGAVEARQALSPAVNVKALTINPLYLGGLPADKTIGHPINTFNGCIKDVNYGGDGPVFADQALEAVNMQEFCPG